MGSFILKFLSQRHSGHKGRRIINKFNSFLDVLDVLRERYLQNSFFLLALVFSFPCLCVVFFAVILPYVSAFWSAFSTGKTITVFENKAVLHVTLFTVRQAFFSTLLALAIGFPGAWYFSRRKNRFLSRALTAIPFAMPSILVVLGFVLFFGNSGWLNRLLSLFPGKFKLEILYRSEAVILAHGFFNFPLVIRLAGDGLSRVRRVYSSAAATLGASPIAAAFSVIIPLSLPAILSASLLVFLYSLTSFAIVLVLGGGPASTTLPVEIYRHARLFLNYHNAGALALVETLISISVFLTYVFFARKSGMITPDVTEKFPNEDIEDIEYIECIEKKVKLFPKFVFRKIPWLIYGIFLSLFVLGPLSSIIVESLFARPSWQSAGELSLLWWQSLGQSCFPAFLRSLLLAFVSAGLSCLLAISAAISAKMLDENKSTVSSLFSNLLRFFAAAPVISSGIVLGLGWLVFYGSSLSRSFPALVVLHSVTALPFAYNSIAEGFRSVPSNLLNAALLCGAGRFRAMLTTALPLSLNRIRSAWGFAAALSLGELNAVMMLDMQNWETLPLYIYRAVGAYRYGSACAAGTLLILACAACFLASEGGAKNAS